MPKWKRVLVVRCCGDIENPSISKRGIIENPSQTLSNAHIFRLPVRPNRHVLETSLTLPLFNPLPHHILYLTSSEGPIRLLGK